MHALLLCHITVLVAAASASAPAPSSAAAAAPCGAGDVRCPAGSPSAGVCVPALAPWCALDAFRNPFAAPAARVADLLPRLSLQQKVNMLQTTPVESSRVPALGLDEVTMAECLHGYCARSPSTLFPQSMTLAASFDAPLLRRVAAAVGAEARAWRNSWTQAGNASVPPPSLTCFAPQLWGDEIEYHLVRLEPGARSAQLALVAPAVLAALEAEVARVHL